MLGKTHMAVGAATALAVLHPSTVTGCICAVAGGIIGGWICDIDVRQSSFGQADDDEEELESHGDERWQILVFVLIIAAICFGVDYFAGNGMCAYISSHFGIPMIVACIVFVAFCIFGIASAHRTAMHSILGGVVLSGCVYVICAPLAPAFALGYISHVVLDIFNKRKIKLFWPLKIGVGLGVCKSNDTANRIVGAVGLIACLALFAMLFVPSVGINESVVRLLEHAGNPFFLMRETGMSNFHIYLIAINIFTFLVYMIDYFAWGVGAYGDDSETGMQEFVHTIFLLLPAAGGAVGMLLAVIIGTGGRLERGEDGNIGFYTHALFFLVIWTCIYLVVCNPFGITSEPGSLGALLKRYHVIPIMFVVLNVLSFIVFYVDEYQYKKMNIREIGEFILAFIGGATGAYLAMVIAKHKLNTTQFGQGVPLMMVMHYVLLSVAYFNGYV